MIAIALPPANIAIAWLTIRAVGLLIGVMEAITPKLTGGKKMLSRTVTLNLGEGDVAQRLKEIQQAHEGVMIGSYPFEKEGGRYGTNIVIRSRDEERMNAAADDVAKIPAEIHAKPPEEAWS